MSIIIYIFFILFVDMIIYCLYKSDTATVVLSLIYGDKRMSEENLDEFRFTYDELLIKCSKLEHKLNVDSLTINDLNNKIITNEVAYLKIIKTLQERIIYLQQSVIDEVK